jgi:hypothetical protein
MKSKGARRALREVDEEEQGRVEEEVNDDDDVGINPEDGWYTRYPTYIEYQARMMLLAEQYPTLVTTFALPRQTFQRRDIQGLRINTGGGGAVRQRVLFVGLQHAREWIAGMVPMVRAATFPCITSPLLLYVSF